jgi:hypothetical protein
MRASGRLASVWEGGYAVEARVLQLEAWRRSYHNAIWRGNWRAGQESRHGGPEGKQRPALETYAGSDG